MTTKSTKPTKLYAHLDSLGACNEALARVGRRSPEAAWRACRRPDWLLWWAAHTKANSHQQIVLAACDCARTVLHLVPDGEDRPRLAVEAAERWAKEPNEANKQKARRAAYAAYAAANAANTAYAAYAAYAAANAANAANAAANANAANTAYADYAAAKRSKICKLIRKRLSCPWDGSHE